LKLYFITHPSIHRPIDQKMYSMILLAFCSCPQIHPSSPFSIRAKHPFAVVARRSHWPLLEFGFTHCRSPEYLFSPQTQFPANHIFLFAFSMMMID
jgi:hypothetical protein